MIVWQCDKSELEPQFCIDIEELLTPSIFTWYVTSGYRGNAEQAILYAKYLRGGAKAAPSGKSAHNFRLAVDVVPDGDAVKSGLQMMWDTLKGVIGINSTDKPWLWLRDKVKAHPRLHSGWVFGDWPHIERYQWQIHKLDDPRNRGQVVNA